MTYIGEDIPSLMAELRANMEKAGIKPPPAEDTMNTANANKPAAKAFKRPSIKSQVKRLLRECEDCGVSSSARLLLVALYGYTDEHGRCYPSHALLEKDTRLAERTIRKALSELTDAGLVRSHKPAREANGAKSRFTIGSIKLPRGQSIYLVWSVASEFGRADFAQLVNPKAKAMKGEPAEGRWAVGAINPASGEQTSGWFTTAQMAEKIRRGEIAPTRKVWCDSIGDWSAAVDIPTLAAHFTRAA